MADRDESNKKTPPTVRPTRLIEHGQRPAGVQIRPVVNPAGTTPKPPQQSK